MGMMERIKAKARTDVKTIVFPEGGEERTMRAAEILVREGLARPVLLGNENRLAAAARSLGIDLGGIRIEDPEEGGKADNFADILYELRKSKGLSIEEARSKAKDPMYYGILMVKTGEADGLVSGAIHTTGDMLRPALQVIGTRPDRKIVSSSFLMDCPDKSLGENGLLVYADCVVVPYPTAEEMAYIAIAAADTARTLCGFEEPRVAMLSFSTKGSAHHAMVDKVKEAVAIAHSLAPDLLLDGEMQFDAALVPEVAAGKAKDSPVAGRANVLVFPDLNAGNIGYKITQRIGKADCFAVLQGLKKPCNDLSRGCSVQDIVNTAAMTAVQAQGG